MKKCIIALLVLLISCGMIFAGTSVQEQVGTAQEAATGTVVTIGLSNYDGVQFSLSGGYYAAAQPGAKAVAVGSGGGDKFGPGARLQYTLFGNSGTYKISAGAMEEAAHQKVFVGITEIDAEAESSDGRTSGSIGTINTATVAGDYNGDGGALRDYGLSSNPAMFCLEAYEEMDVLISGIESIDTWTGTTTNDGPQLYYELIDNINCTIFYYICAES